ncbi:MAG: molybdopterin biosynthesis protein, partial [Chloroflexi bacterium]|nr:molybdopterin biosynthesis protein [Chloroflexota bacterium]
MGEDIVARELVLPENSLLRPQDLGAIAGCGHADVTVRRRPLVGIIPTGSELVPPGHDVSPGDIIEYNSLMLAAQVQEWGGEPVCGNIVRDDMEQLIDAVGLAVQRCDVVVINAGSSAGTEDYTAEVVRRLGSLTVHGVAIRPGHPVVLGIVDHTPVLGIPGYPASALITSELFLQPLVRSMLGLASSSGQVVEATMTRKVLSPMGEDEYLRVKLGKVGNRLIAAPLQRGAGVIMSLVRADGLALIPRFSEGVDAGATISVILRRPLDRIEDTIVAIGSHDVTLDLLASHLARRRSDRSLSSSNVGSLGGLVALRRGEAHLAGTHLLDEATGEYNVPFVRKQLGGKHPGNDGDGGDNGWVVMTLVHREQGIIVAKGNPKRIDSLADLAREGVVFVNRQRGSGTRVLLDYQLQSLGLAPERIQGYDREQFTHLAVAADVASGTADAALGILAAARALDLDFIPLLKERYDLVMSRKVYRSDLMAPMFEILHDDAFRTEVEALGGYDVSHMGNIVTEIS